MKVYPMSTQYNCHSCLQVMLLGEFSVNPEKSELKLKFACMNPHCQEFRKIGEHTVKAVELEHYGEMVQEQEKRVLLAPSGRQH